MSPRLKESTHFVGPALRHKSLKPYYHPVVVHDDRVEVIDFKCSTMPHIVHNNETWIYYYVVYENRESCIMKTRKTKNHLGKYDDMESDTIKKRESIYGCMQGRIVIADDFNETPDSF